MASSHERTVESHQIVCAHCQVTNPSDCKFCRNCGQSLWEPCVGCGAKNATDVDYCGHCGAKLAEGFEDLRQGNESLLESAEQLADRGRFYEALTALRRVASKGHSRLDSYVTKARVRHDQIQEMRRQKAGEAEHALAEAQREVAHRNYAIAKQILDNIPIGLWTAEIKDLSQDVEAQLVRINSLTDRINSALKDKQFENLLPYVKQLKELTHDDPVVNRLHDQLKQRQDRINIRVAQRQLALAKELVTKRRYLEAADQLVGIDRDAIPEKWYATYDTIVELGWLLHQVRNSPFAVAQLRKFAGRLQKLSPQDPNLAKLEEQVTQRLQRSNGDCRFASPWAKPSNGSAIGFPVRHWQGFNQVDGVDDFQELKQDPMSFLVAYGLALQGLGLAHLSLNLIGRRSGLLDRFANLRGASPLNSVWGIDLGTTGIRAIQLSRDKPADTPRVTNVASTRHSALVIEGTASETISEIMRESVQRLLKQASITRGKAVVSFSGPKSLGRQFEIPRLKGSKLVDAVRYEARMQIPIPIEEIEFDWHAWESDEPSRFVAITLLAARKDLVDETLSAFEGAPLKPMAIQSCCLALYNVAYHEFWRGRESEAEAIAILDVGAESSTLIVGSPTQVKYRSLAIGTEKMNRYLMTRFQMTRDKAEATREQWSGCRWMYQVDQELVPLYREISAEVRRTLAAYENEAIAVRELLVTGGGARQYGLLRDFIRGERQLASLAE